MCDDRLTGGDNDGRGVDDLRKVIVSQVFGSLLAPKTFRVVRHVFDEADDVLN